MDLCYKLEFLVLMKNSINTIIFLHFCFPHPPRPSRVGCQYVWPGVYKPCVRPSKWHVQPVMETCPLSLSHQWHKLGTWRNIRRGGRGIWRVKETVKNKRCSRVAWCCSMTWGKGKCQPLWQKGEGRGGKRVGLWGRGRRLLQEGCWGHWPRDTGYLNVRVSSQPWQPAVWQQPGHVGRHERRDTRKTTLHKTRSNREKSHKTRLQQTMFLRVRLHWTQGCPASVAGGRCVLWKLGQWPALSTMASGGQGRQTQTWNMDHSVN